MRRWFLALRQFLCRHRVMYRVREEFTGAYFFRCYRCGFQEQVTRVAYTPKDAA